MHRTIRKHHHVLMKIDILTVLGVISLIYWSIDLINNYFIQQITWSLWFSSVGIGLTAFSLLTRNTFMLSSLFCALFVTEIFWSLGFFSHLLFNKSFMGLTDYLFTGTYSTKDFIVTSYHILMAPFLFIGILQKKVIHTRAWIGAALYTIVLSILTYFFIGNKETVNCVHTIENCKTFLFFLADVANPQRTALGIMLITIIVYIPTNYALTKIEQMLKK